MLLTGLMARELGGNRRVQIVAAFTAITAPIVLFSASLFSYETFNYLWWVLAIYMLLKLLKFKNPRWWLGIGVVMGLGLMTNYLMLVLATGIAVGIIATPNRRYVKSLWLWGGVALSLVIFLPNLVWQMQHHFIYFRFVSSIHARDIQEGRTAGFLIQQFFLNTNIAAIFFWISGLYFYLFSASGQRYRLIGIVYLVSFIILFFAQGRSYYAAQLYPMLIAAGAVLIANKVSSFLKFILYSLIVIISIYNIYVVLPMGQVNSSWWNLSASKNSLLRDEIGWPDLVATIANIRSSLPQKKRDSLGILAANYGIAGAVDLYGSAYGLPEAISGANSYWLRGYPNPPPEPLIVVGFAPADVNKLFANCTLAGRVSNKYGVMNNEAMLNHNIFVCSKPLKPWPEFWKSIQSFQ